MLDDAEKRLPIASRGIAFNNCFMPRSSEVFEWNVKYQVVFVVVPGRMLFVVSVWISPTDQAHVNIIDITAEQREMKAGDCQL